MNPVWLPRRSLSLGAKGNNKEKTTDFFKFVDVE